MTSNDGFFQKQQPAAVLKHAVLAEYCHVFTSMVGSWHNGPIWLIDGYAGPGSYDPCDDEAQPIPGSPIVAMKLAETWHKNQIRDLRCAFIEHNAQFARLLQEKIVPFQQQGLTAVVLEGSVDEQLPAAWRRVAGAPVVTFLDPFGVDAVPHRFMTDMLLDKSRAFPSEVLLNINVEAVWRIGGCLEKRGGVVVAKRDQEKSVERVDQFIGDTWWRERFHEARHNGGGSAAAAAESVVAQYRQNICMTTGYTSMSVPIRRRPGHPPLFHLTLFYRQGVAGYKFADAASRATRKWRNVFRAEDLANALTPVEDALFDFSDEIQKSLEAQAAEEEKAMSEQWVGLIKDNIRSGLAKRGRLSLADDITTILGTTLSLAGEPQIRKAWNQLADEGVVNPRDKSKKKMHQLSIVAKR